MTESLTFTTTVTALTPISPLKIPFSSLAFDPRGKVLYAGAGHSRYDWDDVFHPNLIGIESGEVSSLWKWEFLNSAGFDTVPGTKTGELVRQVAIVERDENALVNDVAYVTDSGVYLHRPESGGHPVEVWISANKQSIPIVNGAERPWGVAAGGENVLYALMVKKDDEPSTVPGVWRANLAALDINDPSTLIWDFVGDPEGIVPPGASSWVSIFSDESCNLICLSVVPGPTTGEDQIFVGERNATLAQGFYRYGPYGVDETVNGWVHILGLSGTYAGGFEHFFTDYHGDPTLESHRHLLEFGWGERVTVGSTTPLIVHPHNPNLMAAALYGNMVVSTTEGEDLDPGWVSAEWGQLVNDGFGPDGGHWIGVQG